MWCVDLKVCLLSLQKYPRPYVPRRLSFVEVTNDTDEFYRRTFDTHLRVRVFVSDALETSPSVQLKVLAFDEEWRFYLHKEKCVPIWF